MGTHTCTSDWLQWILVSTLHGIGNHHSFLILNVCLSVFTQDQTPYSYVEIPVSFFQSVCIQQSHSPNTCIFIQLMGIEDRFPALFCPQSDLLVSYPNRWIQNSIWGEARSKRCPLIACKHGKANILSEMWQLPHPGPTETVPCDPISDTIHGKIKPYL